MAVGAGGEATNLEKSGYGGRLVVSLESRRAAEMSELIRTFGGVPLVAPSLREVPLGENPAAEEFVRALQRRDLDGVVFLTGVGTRMLFEQAEQFVSRDELRDLLGGVTVIARGPKPVRVLREYGVPIALTVPEPNTWRELVEALESEPAGLELRGARLAVQEYGVVNDALLQALRERGAEVTRVPVYRWELPEDRAPLERAVQSLCAGEAGVLLLTSATQAVHLLHVTRDLGCEAALREALRGTFVCSIGPACTEMMATLDLPVHMEPSHPRMGLLVRESAERCARDVSPRPAATLSSPTDARLWEDSVFMRACRREPVPYTPIWLMRQAGRYMPEYREVRARHSFLSLCKNPELVAEVTVTAAERLGVDAAILFADILLIVEPLGLNLDYGPGEGPSISPPVREAHDVDRLQEVPPEALQYVYDAVSATRAALKPSLPLIGFCGAPFTLASYVIEGGGSRTYENTKSLMYRDSGAWHALMERIVRGLVGYVNGQVEAGAQAIQLFDSWVGCLAPEDYREFVLPHSRALIQGIRPGVPVIHFGTDTGLLLADMAAAGGDVIGLDWRTPITRGWADVGERAIQGNLDPLVLFAEPDYVCARAKRILDEAGGRPGHIFNLGHGILPRTPVENVIRLVDYVHEYRPATLPREAIT